MATKANMIPKKAQIINKQNKMVTLIYTLPVPNNAIKSNTTNRQSIISKTMTYDLISEKIQEIFRLIN